MSDEGKAVLTLALTIVKTEEALAQRNLSAPRTVSPSDYRLLRHVCFVMFDSVILVHLAERQGVDWCCTSRLMCENLPINSEMFCTASSAK